MQTYEFTLIFALADVAADPEQFVDALFEEGCDDAVVGIGRQGSIALEFSREASSVDEAVESAIAAVERAIPGSRLIEVKPDLVNLSDISETVGCSRQNVQKYAAGDIKGVKAAFPQAVFSGAQSLWHLYEVANWLSVHAGLQSAPEVLEVARVAARLNVEVQLHRVVAGNDSLAAVLLRRPKEHSAVQLSKQRNEPENRFRALKPEFVLTARQEKFEPAVCDAG